MIRWFTRKRKHSTYKFNESCENCGDGEPYVYLAESEFTDHDSFKRVAEALEPAQPIKFGRLFRCKHCDGLWFSEPPFAYAVYADPASGAAIDDWSRRDLAVSKDHLAIINKIGITGPNRAGEGESRREVPCRCILKSGEVLDYAVIEFTRRPPISGFVYGSRFMDEVAEIEPSPFALSWEIRESIICAMEIRMGYWTPTYVAAPGPRYFTYREGGYFFDYDGVKGEDLTLLERRPDQRWLEVDSYGAVYMNYPDEALSSFLPVEHVMADWADPFPDPYPSMDQPGIFVSPAMPL